MRRGFSVGSRLRSVKEGGEEGEGRWGKATRDKNSEARGFRPPSYTGSRGGERGREAGSNP